MTLMRALKAGRIGGLDVHEGWEGDVHPSGVDVALARGLAEVVEPDGFATDRDILRRFLHPAVQRVSGAAVRPVARVGWIHDVDPWALDGGAELSNRELIRVGADLGYDVRTIHRCNVNEAPFDADLYVICSTATFDEDQLARIERAVYESGRPFIVREHDYGVCAERGRICCEGSRSGCHERCYSPPWMHRLDRFRQRLERCSLAVWISERQRDIHAEALGRVWRREHLLPPPVDPDLFRPVEGIERRDDVAVCTVGQLDERKGRTNVARWAEQHPDVTVEVYVRVEDNGRAMPDNVRILPDVPNRKLPALYSGAGACLFLPSIPEPAGRTPVEAALCGCRPIVNDNWSAACFGLPLDDAEATRAAIRAGRFDFWRAVEEVMG